MRFHIEVDTLTVQFEGLEMLWAAKNKLIVRKTDISRAGWEAFGSVPRGELGLRFGGANIPGVLYAGRFVGNIGRNFVYLQRPSNQAGLVTLQNLLTLELRNSGYARLLFTVEPDIADQIITWWTSAS